MSMGRGPFEPRFDELPSEIPLFPLGSALLLPGGRLPLNIFEPRYLSMVRDAVRNPLRLIGMIQPMDVGEAGTLYRQGCAGRISSFQESDDGRILITLMGTSRFHLTSTREIEDGYLLADIDWSHFEADLLPQDDADIDRDGLLRILRHYFDVRGFSVDWEQLESCENERLVTSLSMICPFDIAEKQALLEAPKLEDRAQLLSAILEMAVHAEDEDGHATH
jgi:Lon protease-like protein